MKKLSESIWSDMQDRSTGEIVRKEDDIDLLDINELCEYLKNIYKTDSDNDINSIEIEGNPYLIVSLYVDEYGYLYRVDDEGFLVYLSDNATIYDREYDEVAFNYGT